MTHGPCITTFNQQFNYALLELHGEGVEAAINYGYSASDEG